MFTFTESRHNQRDQHHTESMYRLLDFDPMSETVEHEKLDNDAANATSEQLAQVNLKSMSFVQLRRLHKVLTQSATEIDREIASRAEADNFGDTVTVPPQKV